MNKKQGVVKNAPDLLILPVDKKPFFIEFKDVGKKLTTGQEVLRRELLDNFKTEVVLVNTYGSFAFLDALDRYNITDSINEYPFKIYKEEVI